MCEPFECGLKGFGRRILYKISSQKILSFFCASLVIVVLAYMYHPEKMTETLISEAMTHVKVLAIALMTVKGIQNIVGIVKNGNSNGRE